MTTEAQLQAQLDTMAAALHRMADKLVAEQAAATEALLAMTQERDACAAIARQNHEATEAAIARAVKAEALIEVVRREERRKTMRVADDAADEAVELRYALGCTDAHRNDLLVELAAAYRTASALRRGVPRWLVPTCAAVGAARDAADEWRDRAKGLVVRARRKARKAVGR